MPKISVKMLKYSDYAKVHRQFAEVFTDYAEGRASNAINMIKK
ncbi:hypothetical protein [Salinibacillus xinjiangensis]|nr:hypothetical protein [Salinibacillus xinjiangensis]